MAKIIASIDCNRICVYCKKKIKAGQEIAILPKKVVLHVVPCLEKIKKQMKKND